MDKDASQPKCLCWGLLRRRSCLVPTWRGALALAVVLVGLGLLFLHTIYPFLALTDPVPGGVLVVEGWASDGAMQAAMAEFQHHHYDKVFVTGTPMDHGAPLSEYKTYAQLGAAILLKLGLSTNVVQAVPAPAVRRDRTYASAVSLREWCHEHGLRPVKVNLLTAGAHARRSRLLFERALGPEVTVGVISVEDDEFDPHHWWRSSPGVRTVIGETLAYGYARFLFHAPKD